MWINVALILKSVKFEERKRERVNTSILTFILTQKLTVYDEVSHSNICMINSKKFEEPAMLYRQGKWKPQSIEKLIDTLALKPRSAYLVLDFGFPIFLDRVCLRGLRV